MLDLKLVDGEALFYDQLFSASESADLFDRLNREIKWRREKIRLYGKEIDIPRLTAWYGEPGKSYTYSGISMNPLPWIAPLREIKEKIYELAGTRFNSVLLNLYRSGKDGVAWHSDDEPELGPEPVIGSVSVGGTRLFQLKHKSRKYLERVEIPLTSGSFLLMRGQTQRHWLHRIPKTKKPAAPRINLTFRVI
jgi:alkylated DNA repair dioxygenase AlkB